MSGSGTDEIPESRKAVVPTPRNRTQHRRPDRHSGPGSDQPNRVRNPLPGLGHV